MLEINQFNIRPGVYKDNSIDQLIIVRSIVTFSEAGNAVEPKVIYEPLQAQYELVNEQRVMVQVGLEISVKDFLATLPGKEQLRFTYQ